jgi:hypothetical protein
MRKEEEEREEEDRGAKEEGILVKAGVPRSLG